MEEANTSLTNDLAFTDIFGSQQNEKYLEYLMECLFQKENGYYHKKLDGITLERTLPKKYYNENRSRMDLIFEVDNTILNLEMYTSFTKNSLRKSAFYLVAIGNQQLGKGTDYKKIKKIYQINFVSKISGIDLERECQSVLTNYPLTEVCEMLIIRLDLLDDVDCNNFKDKKLLQFLKFLVADTYEARKEVSKGSEILMEFNEVVTDYFKDPEFLSKFDFQKRKEEISYNDGVDDGIAIGKSEGITLGQEMTAKNMLQSEFELSVIEKTTGLSKPHIEKLQKEMSLCEK